MMCPKCHKEMIPRTFEIQIGMCKKPLKEKAFVCPDCGIKVGNIETAVDIQRQIMENK